MLHDEYLNPWYIEQRPEPEDTLLRMHYGNCDKLWHNKFSNHCDVEVSERQTKNSIKSVNKESQISRQIS